MARLIFAYLAFLVLLGGSPAMAADQADAAVSPQAAAVTTYAVHNWQEDVFFYTFAALTVFSALGVVLSGSVVRMAMWLFATFGAIAMLFFLLQAYFLGAVQLIVYVGGILVLIVFGIMLTSSSPWLKFDVKKGELIASGVICTGLFASLSYILYHAEWRGSEQITSVPVAVLGKSLLTDYLVPFEVASVLLLVVMIGAAYLARQERN